MPSTNRSKSSGRASRSCARPRAAGRRTPSRHGGEHALSPSRARRPRMSSGSSAITSAMNRSKNAAWRASSTSCVARKISISPRGRGQHERRQVGRDALLADVEARQRPHRVHLALGRRREPVLLVDAEVDLVRLPVLALPERVELLVREQAGAGRRRFPRRPFARLRSLRRGSPWPSGRAPFAEPQVARSAWTAAGAPRARARRRRGPRSARSTGRSA